MIAGLLFPNWVDALLVALPLAVFVTLEIREWWKWFKKR